MEHQTEKEGAANPTRRSSRRIIVSVVFLLGLLVLGNALATGINDGAFSWWPLALLTVAASLFGIRLPLKQESGAITVTVSDCFIFLGLFLFGVSAAVLIAALDAITVCLKSSWKGWEKMAFNIGQMAISVFLAGTVFCQTNSSGPPLEILQLNVLPLTTIQILACAVLYYSLSGFLIGLVVASCGELSLTQLFRDYLLRLSPFTVLSVAAALAVLLPLSRPLTSILAVLLIGASYLWTRRIATAETASA